MAETVGLPFSAVVHGGADCLVVYPYRYNYYGPFTVLELGKFCPKTGIIGLPWCVGADGSVLEGIVTCTLSSQPGSAHW
jgi:chloramphenicol O-acetyltransferase